MAIGGEASEGLKKAIPELEDENGNVKENISTQKFEEAIVDFLWSLLTSPSDPITPVLFPFCFKAKPPSTDPETSKN